MKPYWIGGNWKCNGNRDLIETILKNLDKSNFNDEKIDVVVFPTSLHLERVNDKINKKFNVGIQNLSQPKPGAFTGEIEVGMVREIGVRWVLIGHSERRKMFNETDQVVANKVKIALDNDFNITICIGETLSEREGGITFEVITTQLKNACENINKWDNVVIAYEPVWAIGTGVVASVDQVQEVHQFIKKFLREFAGDKTEGVRIVYGGSVNAKNCQELAKCPEIDGFLVGGASLFPEFTTIIDVFLGEK